MDKDQRTWGLADTHRLRRAIVQALPKDFDGEILVKVKGGGIANLHVTLCLGGYRREDDVLLTP